MPKQLLEINNFAGGLNNYSDPRDIQDSEFQQNWNAVVDKAGIIRVGGMGQHNILTEYHSNERFQEGYGLFQFSADYSMNSIDGVFGNGIKTGTSTSDASSANTITLEATATANTNEYQNMTLFIYDGQGKGQSRKISSNTNATPPVLTITPNWTTNVNTTSKYIIYRWETSATWDGKDNTTYKDVITNGSETDNSYLSALPTKDDDYYIFSRKTSIGNATSENLGYTEYKGNITIKPGIQYHLSFDCAAKDKWYNMVSDGDEDGSSSLYGDKVPWVQLYSTSVADTKSSIKTMNDESNNIISPTVGEGTLSATWTASNSNQPLGMQEAVTMSGVGTGAKFFVMQNSSNEPLISTFDGYVSGNFQRGQGYKVGDILRIYDPLNDSKYCTLTVASVNFQGLSLYRNKWINGSAQPNYLTEVTVNYVDNGDFADNSPSNTDDNSGNDIAWTQVGATTLLTCTTLNADGYDGVDGTCKMSSLSGMSFVDGPQAYIYQDLTLDLGIPYHLNFLYDSPDGIMYKVRNDTTSTDIIPWTRLGTSRKIPGVERYVYAGAEYNSKSKDVGGHYTMDYITFIAVGNSNSDTIRIQFAPIAAGSDVSLHGVTVHKAHNDLVTMSYNKSSSNPFSDGILNFNNYSMSFILPDNFGEDSNWVLRLHAGEFGYRASNNITTANSSQAANTQEVYFDNIKLTSEEGDTVTLLSNNASNYSEIFAHSKLSGNWDKNFLRFEGLNSKPVYNYINGMLKISDANFSNANGNFLTYYDKSKGWKKSSKSIPTPPSIITRDVAGSNIDNILYNAIETSYDQENEETLSFLNTYFKNETFANYNWDLAQYGVDAHHGLVIRYVRDDSILTSNNDIEGGGLSPGGTVFRTGHVMSGQQSFLYNVNNPYFQSGFINGDEIASRDADLDAVLDTGGLSGSNAQATDNLHGTYPSHNPLYFVIKGNDIENNLGMDDVQPMTSTDVHSVKLKVKYTLQGISHSQYDWGDSASMPYFTVEMGKIFNGYDGNLKEDLIQGNDISFNIDDTYKFQQVGFDVGSVSNKNGFMYLGDNENSAYTNHSDENVETWRDRYADVELYNGQGKVQIESVNFDGGYNEACRGHVVFYVELFFDQRQIARNDDILIKIKIQNNERQRNKHLGYFCTLPGETHFAHYLRWYVVGGSSRSAKKSGIGQSYDTQWARDWSHYETIEIHEAKVKFYSNFNPDEVIKVSEGCQLDFAWDTPKGTTAMGWGGRKFVAGVSCTNIFGEESSLKASNNVIGESFTGESIIEAGYSPSVDVHINNTHMKDDFIAKTKFYLKDTESDIWYLQFYIDHKTELLHTTISGVTSKPKFSTITNTTSWNLERENIKNFNEVNSYESETSISQEDGMSHSNLICRYKTSVVANNRLYVGNILQNGEIMSDRMIKSPIGKYNLLPKSNFIDVAINDGDEITALAYYKDKLLQFKKRKVFVISTSGDYEFLEDTFDNVGVNLQASVCTTPYGIAWANKSGLYLYNGKELKNLLENKIAVNEDYTVIDNNSWTVGVSAYSNNPSVAFDEKYDNLLIKFTVGEIVNTVPEVATYNFLTNSFTFSVRSIAGNGTQANSGKTSNMITNEDGEILYYRYHDSDNATTAYNNSIKKWVHSPIADSTSKILYFVTKDFTFGNIAVRKKLYKVYITYKTNSDSNVAVTAAVDGNSSYNVAFSTNSKFKGTTTACYGSSTLDSTGNEWKTAELKFDNPSLVNNVYSFKLLFSSGLVASDFEINDISISFKTKRVK